MDKTFRFKRGYLQITLEINCRSAETLKHIFSVWVTHMITDINNYKQWDRGYHFLFGKQDGKLFWHIRVNRWYIDLLPQFRIDKNSILDD